MATTVDDHQAQDALRARLRARAKRLALTATHVLAVLAWLVTDDV